MCLLGRLLPQMVGHRVPEGEKYWISYLDLLKIHLAPELAEDEVALLATLISDYHLDFKQLHPNASIIPKMRNVIVHMPRLTLK